MDFTEIKTSELHMLSLRDLAIIANEYAVGARMDPLEMVAVVGALAGSLISSNPNAEYRGVARQSVLNSMNQAIVDGLKARKIDLHRLDRVDGAIAAQLGRSIRLNNMMANAIREAIDTIERGSTSAPVVECLKAALHHVDHFDQPKESPNVDSKNAT